MELFTVQRYDEKLVEQNPEKEFEILDQLLKKAERKKRKLEKSAEISIPISDISEQLYNNDSKKVKIDDEEFPSTEELKNAADAPETLSAHPDFAILGDDVFITKKKVDMVLPPWLAHPTIISTKISEDIKDRDIGSLPYLSDQMKENLKAMRIEKLFPVQAEVIPWLLKVHSKPMPFRPRDICVSAPTGSGKTLAFAVPIVELLSKRVERKILALIVLPVNELAMQVYKVFKSLVRKTNLSVSLLSKSFQFDKEQQHLVDFFKGKYYSKVDILVTTPGRLVEHLHSTKGFCLKSLKFLVIDEADRIMAQIHHNWLYHLDSHVKDTSDMILSGRPAGLSINDLESEAQKQPHKLLFSATLSQDPEKLQSLKLFQPKLFTSVINAVDELAKKFIEKSGENQSKEIRGEFVGKYTTPDELTEQYCITETALKPLTLYTLILQNRWNKFLCFTNSVEGARRLAFILDFLLNRKLLITELSAALSPKSRNHVLKNFALGNINGLVCSDALARGIDIPEVDIVISYDVPRHINTYIHRIGRTARAGRPGTAITLLNPKEFNKFKNTLMDAGKEPINEIKIEGSIEEDNAKRYTAALSYLQKNVQSEKFLKKQKKGIAKEKADNIPTQITPMEQLQLDVTNAMVKEMDMEHIIERRKEHLKRNRTKK